MKQAGINSKLFDDFKHDSNWKFLLIFKVSIYLHYIDYLELEQYSHPIHTYNIRCQICQSLSMYIIFFETK